MRRASRHRHLLSAALMTPGGMALLAMLGHGWGERRELARQTEQSQRQLALQARALAQLVDRGALHPPLRGRTVWCVDDDPRGGEAALAAAQPSAAPDLVLLDLHAGGADGPALFARMAEHWASAPQAILFTGDRDGAAQAIARRRGWCLLPKPVRPPAQRALVSQLLLRAA